MIDKNKISSLALLVILIMTAFPSFSQCDPPLTNLGNDTTLCTNSTLVLNAGVADKYIWSTGASESTIEVTSGGKYWVKASMDCGSEISDTIVITQVPLPDLLVNVNTEKVYCKGEVLDLAFVVDNPITSNIYIIERTDNSTEVLSIDTTGTFVVSAIDENNCEATRELTLEFQYPYGNEEIALTTYDNEEDKYVVVWTKTPGKRTESFMLYNGNTTTDVMGEASYNTTNQMVDYKSDPHAKPGLYNLMIKDSCDNLSDWDLQKAHKTMYLDVYTNAENQMELNWEKYVGFNYDKYYIYRGTMADNLEVIDSVTYNRVDEKTSYVDTKAVAGQQYYYQVIIKTPKTIYLDNDRKASAGPYVHSLSNLEDHRLQGTGISEMQIFRQNIKIYPNPVSDNSQVSFKLDESAEMRISITNLLGQEIYNLFDGFQEIGIQSISLRVANEKLNSGIYFIQFELKGLGSYCEKIIKN
jgi:type IX secretion system substrate protein